MNKFAKTAVAICTSIAITQFLAWIGSTTYSYKALRNTALIAIIFQWIVFFHASGIIFGNERTEKYYDLTGASTYISLVFTTVHWRGGFDSMGIKQFILNICVLLWALRLGTFLYYRSIKNNGIDSRFTEIKQSLGRFVTAWTLQGVWVFITALPIFYLNTNKISTNVSHANFNILNVFGLLLWLFGFLFETIADVQKLLWRMKEANHHSFICYGLWSLSRHPNYFGEICIWIGFYIASYSEFETNLQAIAALISPIFVTLLLVYISGIPLLESAADKQWGDDKAYKDYKQRVPVLIPWIGRTGDAPF